MSVCLHNNGNQNPNARRRMRKKIKVASSTRKISSVNMICLVIYGSNDMSVVFQPVKPL